MKDFRGITFTNGEKVADWLSTLSPEDRERAEACIADMTENHIPLNFLQVKIRMTSQGRRAHQQSAPVDTPREPAVEEPQNRTDAHGNTDYYHTHTPYRPQPAAIPEPAPRKKISWWMIALAVIFVLLLTAVATNPSEERHKEVMAEEIKTACTELAEDYAADQNGFGGLLPSMFSEILTQQLANTVSSILLNTTIEYHNYWLFSECTAEMFGEKHEVSFGIFGMVFTFDKEDIKKAVSEIASQGII